MVVIGADLNWSPKSLHQKKISLLKGERGGGGKVRRIVKFCNLFALTYNH